MHKLAKFILSNSLWNKLLWAFIVLFTIIALWMVNVKEKNLRIKSVKMEIKPEEELHFLDSLSLIELIKSSVENEQIIGAKLESVKPDVIEKTLEENPFVEKADIFVDLGGVMKIKILQRTPVLRVFNQFGQTYYVAKNGFKMPVNNQYTARVITANGKIAETLVDSAFTKNKTTIDLLKIANFCYNDLFWRAQIEQLYVDNFNDILLIPKVGNHTIVVGTAEGIEKKMEKLKTFYYEGLNHVGWNQYKTINLKYENQIVAEKTNYNTTDTTKN